MSINLEKINLQKESIINLKKASGIGARSTAQVVLVTDRSGSMNHLYKDGTVQRTVERILPFGLAFDDNGEVDSYAFHNKYYELEPITLNNLNGYVPNHLGKISYGGTSYAPVLKEINRKYTKNSSKKSLLDVFRGVSNDSPMDYPVYVIFITDGENDDKAETDEIIRELSGKGVFIQFIGVGSDNFKYLNNLDNLSGRKLDNVNFFRIDDLNEFSDDQLYLGLMMEYPDWYKQAINENFIK
jgi:hypothetical protein